MISKDIKALAISLRTQVSTPRCVESLGKQAILKPAIEKLEKALRFHKGDGYEMDLRPVPIERYTIHIFNCIVDEDIPVQELKQQCAILTSAEKDSILGFAEAILDYMGEYEAKVSNAQRHLRKAGLTIDDLIELEEIRKDEEEAQDLRRELQALALSLRLEYANNDLLGELSQNFAQYPVLLDLEKAIDSDAVGINNRSSRYSGSKDLSITECTAALLDKAEQANLTIKEIRDQAALLGSMEKEALLTFFERLKPVLERKYKAATKINSLLDKAGIQLWELEELMSEIEEP